MKSLSETWFAEGYIDFELKKYTLLAYLQQINNYFNENKLYPQLGDVIFHYNNIVSFKENKKFLRQQFPKKITGIQLQKIQVLYEQMIEDDEIMNELEEIIDYAQHKMKNTISQGTEIYEMVQDKMIIAPVGLTPLDLNEGYLFIASKGNRETNVYQYRLSIFEKYDEKFRGLKTEFIYSWYRSISNTYESIKTELIRNRKVLPNPAVYSIETQLTLPVEETLLPVAKRNFVRYITTLQS